MLRFAFRIGNKTDVLLGQIPAMPCLRYSFFFLFLLPLHASNAQRLLGAQFSWREDLVNATKNGLPCAQKLNWILVGLVVRVSVRLLPRN